MLPVPRRRDWVERFEKAIHERAETKFSWGTHDCVTAVAYCLKAMTSKNIIAHLRKYSSLRGALTRINRYGSLDALVTDAMQRLNWEEVKPLFAQRGDCVLIKGKVDPRTGLDVALGIVDHSGWRVLVADEKGWGEFVLTDAIRAWRVG